METSVLLIFDLLQRTIKRRPDAFDKCSVFEFKNSALFLAFVFQDIKDIKREIASRIQTARPCKLSPSPRGANEFVRTNYSRVGFRQGPSRGKKNLAERTHRIEQDVFSGNGMQPAWPGRCFSPYAVRSMSRKFAERTEGLKNVCSEQ